ncbi:MAG: hypothetical protein QG622_3179, partial [Actinomycetota bacterium]|nr:hypothetical protein [Actinomycetota bacterium]
MVTNPQVDGQAEDDGAGRADVCALEGCDIPLPARALDEHGRLRSGRRPRYCCKGHADAASRQRRARDLAAVADPLAQVRGLGETFLPAARELRTDLAGMIERFEGAQKGALGRVTVAEQEAAEALADAHAARQEADAAEQARRAAVAGAREDRQARDNAVREAERSREDAERARTLAWEQVAEHERARGHAEAARDAAEQSVESLAAEAREMRGLLDAERARVAVLTEGLGAARADLERVRGERAGLSVRLEAAERAVRDQAEAARRDLERAQG